MNSPFPGMDPYLETPAYWADFHHHFVDSWCVAAGNNLPAAYDARVNTSVELVQMSPEVIKLIYPDVAVTRRPGETKRTKAKAGTMLLEPETIPHEFLEEVRHAWIEILHLPDRELVAVLELLSPFNKTGEGFRQYRAKRRNILLQKVHLVELDLLVGGKRLPMAKPLPTADYYALVSHVENRPNCDVFHWTVRQPLPTIPIPLRAPDADIHIDLGEVFRESYQRGRYARSLFYNKPPDAPLSKKDAQWAATVASKRKR